MNYTRSGQPFVWLGLFYFTVCSLWQCKEKYGSKTIFKNVDSIKLVVCKSFKVRDFKFYSRILKSCKLSFQFQSYQLKGFNRSIPMKNLL